MVRAIDFTASHPVLQRMTKDTTAPATTAIAPTMGTSARAISPSIAAMSCATRTTRGSRAISSFPSGGISGTSDTMIWANTVASWARYGARPAITGAIAFRTMLSAPPKIETTGEIAETSCRNTGASAEISPASTGPMVESSGWSPFRRPDTSGIKAWPTVSSTCFIWAAMIAPGFAFPMAAAAPE